MIPTQIDTNNMSAPKENRFGMLTKYFLDTKGKWLSFTFNSRVPFGIQDNYQKDGFEVCLPLDCIQDSDNLIALDEQIKSLGEPGTYKGLVKKGYLTMSFTDKSEAFDQANNVIGGQTKNLLPKQSDCGFLVTPRIWKQRNQWGCKLTLNQVKIKSLPDRSGGLETGVCYLD